MEEKQITVQTQETPPAISFNFDQLKAWAVGMTERYKDLVVTEDAIADVKRDMAELNKAKKAVDDARKEAVRRVSEPIKAFEAQIKEVTGIFESVYSALADQVKAFEAAQRDEKRIKILELIQECTTEKFCGAEYAPRIEIPVQDRWLNKTTTMKSIREDIIISLDRYIEEEQRKKALEQAKKDRVAAIENHVKALNQQYEFAFSVSKFIDGRALNMGIPLDQILSGIGTYFERMIPKKAPPKPVPEPTPTPGPIPDPEPETPAPTARKTAAISIIIEYDMRNKSKIMECLSGLRDLCVNYAERRR
ncbi:DUF1351 domain-containing protein [Desulfosarcina sp. OttesenSCG-928-G17]|nr:DUF1351 domain-containing protein [Desulfosarcina sp. OttesenSCG-928-G17]